MGLKVTSKASKVGNGWKAVTLSHGGKEKLFLLPAAMAKSLEIRLNCMDKFKYGVTFKGNVCAMFRDPDARELFRNALDEGSPDYED